MGKGGFGKVVYATDALDKSKEYAVKIIPGDKLKKNSQIVSLEKEKCIVDSIRSDYVVRLFGTAKTSTGDHLLLLEFCNGGDLSLLLHLKGRFN